MQGTERPATSDIDEPLLRLVGVEKAFRRPDRTLFQAVKPLDLSLGHGETLALVGESGSGKSTLGRIALGLLPPDRGQVFFNGQCLSTLSPREFRMQRIAMQPIFQDAAGSLNPRRTVRSLMDQALRYGGAPNAAVTRDQLLKDVDIGNVQDVLSRFPHQLSGGQRQRLAIARALALNPRLIIADEPLSGSDVSIRGQLLNLLIDIRKRHGVAYLMITHDISVARAFAHRVAVMKLGEIVELGPADDVFDNPQHDYTRRLLAAVPILGKRKLFDQPAQDIKAV